MKIESILNYFSAVQELGAGRFMALCPAHKDKTPSLSISQGNNGKTVLNCLAGCETKDVLGKVGLKMKDLFANDQPVKDVLPGCTFSLYVKEKKIPEAFLRNLGIEQGFYMGKPCLIIPYFNETGNQIAVRYRTALIGKDKFRWRKGDKPCLYGLDRLGGYSKSDIFIIEGESDCHTLWVNNIPALGLPGASSWKEDRDSSILNRFETIYVIIEPDAGGKAVLKWLRNSSIQSKVKLVSLPTNDVSELYVEDPDIFKEIFKTCVEQAVSFSDFENQELEPEPENQESIEWDKARELFPRISFPWEVLPAKISESLKQLARSHATSPLSLPGTAVSIFSSILGSTVNVSPKKAWKEPFIFWFADIRPSGSGKTPAMKALCKILYEAQTQADKDYKQRLEEELSKKKKEQRPVPRSRSYFITDLTLEGLKADAVGHGGSVCILDELSGFINGQNQYKAKGNDREAWISLHDGNPARIVRSKESYTVSGLRISIVGGIQPVVWQMSFGGQKGLFLSDGTVFRFLATYEGDPFYNLTVESWSDENREVWERTLTLAMEWADLLVFDEGWKPKTICLSEDAQNLFFNWRNRLQEAKNELPDQLKGHIPKLIGYSLRLAGVLYCLKHFAAGGSPGLILDRKDMQKGIDAVTFYAGHLVDAAKSLCSDKPVTPFEVTDQVKHLAETLEGLRNEIDNGRLAIGFIQERFNLNTEPEYKIKTPHAIGALLRKYGLTIPAGHFRSNKKTGAKCLSWNKETENFLKQVNKVNVVNNTINHAGLEALTLKNQSQRSQQNPQNITQNPKSVDIVDIEKTKSTPAKLRASSDVDKEDIVDIVSMNNFFDFNNAPRQGA